MKTNLDYVKAHPKYQQFLDWLHAGYGLSEISDTEHCIKLNALNEIPCVDENPDEVIGQLLIESIAENSRRGSLEQGQEMEPFTWSGLTPEEEAYQRLKEVEDRRKAKREARLAAKKAAEG